MTYGWAILILAVVVASLAYLGVFNTATAQPNVCIGITGFSCTNPILYGSGQLNVSIGQIGQTITITNTYCTSGPAAPSGAAGGELSVIIYSNQNEQLQFQCALKSSAVGTQFSGYLWIVYNTGTQSNIVQEIATVKASVISGGSGPNTAVGYVPITLTNSQALATGSNFQDMITVDSAAYTQYINGEWSNVEFTTGAPYDAGGTPIYAWIESNPSNTASSTVIWLNLPGGIPASSTANVYMNFMTNNVMVSGSSYTGEAPQLSPSYAEYDDGANVFNFYDNFAGTSLNSQKWNNQGVSGITVNNGLTINYPHAPYNGIISSNVYNPTTNILDVYMTMVNSNQEFVGWSTTANVLLSSFGIQYYFYLGNFNNGVFSDTPLNGCIGGGSSCAHLPYLFSIWSSSSSSYATSNYLSAVTLSTDFTPSTDSYIVLYGQLTEYTVNYVRLRTVPPNEVMPSYSFGSFS